MSNVTQIPREPDRICLDCGKVFWLAHAELVSSSGSDEKLTGCPRCVSINHTEYVESQHQNINVEVPEGWEHPMEAKAREIFDRVSRLTGWREAKVRLFFQTPNPMLGNVSPEWMIMNGRAERLERFVSEAEADSEYYQSQYGKRK